MAEGQKEGCKPVKYATSGTGEPGKHTMQEASTDFTTHTKNLFECMAVNDRGSSHGFSFTVPNRTGTQYAAKMSHLELNGIGRMTPL